MTGFEPATPRTPCVYATELRHIPIKLILILNYIELKNKKNNYSVFNTLINLIQAFCINCRLFKDCSRINITCSTDNFILFPDPSTMAWITIFFTGQN